MRSNLDLLISTIALVGWDKALRQHKLVRKYLDLFLWSDEYFPAATVALNQVAAKGFADISDVKALCEFFPHSCHKILTVYNRDVNVRIPDFYTLLMQDLETILKEGNNG